jgi:GNAT superfamily N-acetyltransferase
VTETLELREEAYDSPVATALVAAVQQEYVARYGGPDDSPVAPGDFAAPNGHFVVGYVGVTPVASGAVRRLDPRTVEIKRMFVVPEHRSRGFARAMLRCLEELAGQMGAEQVILETGMKQPEAMRLYESAGYTRIDGFGHYCGSELAVSYGKSL